MRNKPMKPDARLGSNTANFRRGMLNGNYKGEYRNTMGSRYKRTHGEVKRYVELPNGERWTLDPKHGGLPISRPK